MRLSLVQHACAALVVVSVIGGARLTHAMRQVHGRQVASQAVLAAWSLAVVVMVYLGLDLALFSIGLTVPLFADSHFRAWSVEQLGPGALLKGADALLERSGPMRFVTMASVGPLLLAVVGGLLLVVSIESSVWGYWLGLGLLCSGPIRVLEFTRNVRRRQQELRSGLGYRDA
jgi:hypothetical protein